MRISRAYEAYDIPMQQVNKAMNAYKYNAPEMCKTCTELSVYKTCNIALLHTTEGLLTFNKEIVYCPTCGKKVSYGRCK